MWWRAQKPTWASLQIAVGLVAALAACKPAEQELPPPVFAQEVTIKCYQFADTSYIIRSQQEYDRLFSQAYFIGGSGCQGWQPPTVDFARYTLLGHRTQATGCEVKYRREVGLLANQYTGLRYRIGVNAKGACLQEWASWNWVIVDRLAPTDTVLFETYRYTDLD